MNEEDIKTILEEPIPSQKTNKKKSGKKKKQSSPKKEEDPIQEKEQPQQQTNKLTQDPYTEPTDCPCAVTASSSPGQSMDPDIDSASSLHPCIDNAS